MVKGIVIVLISGIISAFSQVLLKKSAQKNEKKGIGEYLNPYVIGGYALSFVCMILMIAAYKSLPLKYGVVFESLVYLHVMIFGRIFFGEKITGRKVMGNIAIIIGVVVFSYH